ncbi:LamG domain-containing protein [Streptomyces avicenniae]|uniref:LamG domain-containing protein n=1 Tax=Streptomyces avicenniae TaxID=500153 RepID=UPI0006992A4D|nr:LamG domain-containing protein [Streptomyces avicenniae]
MGGERLRRGAERLATLLAVGVVLLSSAPAVAAAVPGDAVGDGPGVGPGPEAEALAEAERSGQPVEISGLTSETSRTFAEPDGSFTTEEHLRPVRVRDADGEWVDTDATLRVLPGGGIAPVASVLDVAISGGGDQPMFTLSGLAGRELTVDWPGELPTPEVSGTVATYPEVLPGVDLQVRAEVDNVSHLLVVKTPEAAADPALDELVLPVATQGLDLRTDGEGGLEAADEGAGGVVFSAAQPMMWDSSGAPDAAARTDGSAADPAEGPSGSALLAPVTAEVSSEGEEVVLTPDQDLLQGPGTTYPVYIDPQWWTERDTEWGMVSRHHSNKAFFKFSGDEGVGMCPYGYDADCNYQDVKRLFYQMPTARYAGKSILDAEFVIENSFSFNCRPQEVQLWRTRDVSAGTTWDRQTESGYWIDRLQTRDEAHGWDGCPAGDIEFWAGRAVSDAASHGWPTVTFGLRATDENDHAAWKRFDDTAFLRVHYNRAPTQPRVSGLTMNPGGGCVPGADARRINRVPSTDVEAHDPDGDDIAVQWRVAEWDNTTHVLFTSGLSAMKASGSTFRYQLPNDGRFPANALLSWGVRVWDGAAWSPWSFDGAATACHFIWDPTHPDGPTIGSVQYPESDPSNPADPWMNGVGRYGAFTLAAAEPDVVRYTYGVNGNPTTANSLTTSGGAPRSIDFMPTRVGVNFITAQSWDAAGNNSDITTYRFRVRTGQPERAAFGFDEAPGSGETFGSAGSYPASLEGGLRAGGAGRSGNGLTLDGVDDHARTPGGIVDTTQGFTVSLWARLPEESAERATVAVSQSGAHQSAFELYHSAALGGWVFYRDTTDGPVGGTVVRASQPACPAGDATCVERRSGRWTHVVGVMDHGADEMRLFIDGQRVASATYTADWDSRASLLIGANANDGVAGNFFAGDLDDLRVWDVALRDTQVAALHADEPVMPGRPMKAAWPLDEPASAVAVTGTGESVAADLAGGATPGTAGVTGTSLHLNGTDAYAVSPRPVVNTYYSFSTSFWARLPENADRTMTVLDQEGTNNAAFEVYHSKAQGGWVFARATADTADAGAVRINQGACSATSGACPGAGEWQHVVAVYDHVARSMTLFVNGRRVSSADYAYNWTPNGPLYLGAARGVSTMGTFFEGSLDELRLFDRVISEEEIQDLFRRNPVLEGRWRLDGASGTPPVTPEATGAGPGATLHGNATFAPGVIGDGQALSLDGNGDYAATAGAPFDSAESWTVSAWVAAPARPQRQATVLSLAGNSDSALILRYVPDPDDPAYAGRWQLDVATADGAGGTHQIAEHDAFPTATGWNHVAAVYDAFADQMSLYVNGELQQVVCEDAEDPECTDILSWRASTWPFEAGGGLQIGRSRTGGVWGEYWSGVIDDVWAFRGVVPEDDIRRLAYRERNEDLDTP